MTVIRSKPPLVAGEREMLDAWLDYHRATLLLKCEGLSDEQMKLRSCPPSPLSLLGLVRHMTEVENGWFADWVGTSTQRYCTEDNPDADFADVDNADVAESVAAYEAECAASRDAVRGLTLDDTETSESSGKTYSLRWIYVHMLEEYARHNGHADLLRERIDGAVGD